MHQLQQPNAAVRHTRLVQAIPETHSSPAKIQRAASYRGGFLTPRVSAVFCFQKSSRSQRQHRTWKQAGTYQDSVWQCACPRETLSFSTTRGGNALSTCCNISTGQGISCTVELRKWKKKYLRSELENHSRCQYFPVFRHATSTFQASPSSV